MSGRDRHQVLHRTSEDGAFPITGWRRRSWCALAGLRLPVADHTREQGELLRRHASGAMSVVELGVWEGGGALELRQGMHEEGTLYLVDPYRSGTLPALNLARLVARRLLRARTPGLRTVWIRESSQDAALEWESKIDFLFIDGIHTFEAAAQDWRDWSPHVVPGGSVALRCDLVGVAPGGRERVGIVDWVQHEFEGWAPADTTGSIAVMRRVG